MVFPGVAGAVVAGNFHLLQQILESPCISGADRLTVYQRAVSALIHLRAEVVGYPVNQNIVHQFFLFIIARKSGGLIFYAVRIFLKNSL